jgi:glycosyl transferase family 25
MNFNWEIYRELNPDLIMLGLRNKNQYNRHYMIYGKQQGKKYNIFIDYPDFNHDGYRANYEDVKNMNNEHLELHWICCGIKEGRKYTNNINIEPELFNFIEKVLYINLDIRTDRKQEIEQQFNNVNLPEDKIERISAVYNERGALGCTASHIKCIKYAKEQGWKNVLILEDDYNFINNNRLIKLNLEYIKEIGNDWDMILFAGNIMKVNPYNNILNKVINVQTTSGYMVNNCYYDKLLENYEEGYIKLSNYFIPGLYALDIYWKLLQPNDRWYIFKKKMGYQRASYSNIENAVTQYNC